MFLALNQERHILMLKQNTCPFDIGPLPSEMYERNLWQGTPFNYNPLGAYLEETVVTIKTGGLHLYKEWIGKDI